MEIQCEADGSIRSCGLRRSSRTCTDAKIACDLVLTNPL
jgi:hypothetical protein